MINKLIISDRFLTGQSIRQFIYSSINQSIQRLLQQREFMHFKRFQQSIHMELSKGQLFEVFSVIVTLVELKILPNNCHFVFKSSFLFIFTILSSPYFIQNTLSFLSELLFKNSSFVQNENVNPQNLCYSVTKKYKCPKKPFQPIIYKSTSNIMFGSGSDNQATITRKTKIKQKHKLNDPSLLVTNPVVVPQTVQPGLTTATIGTTGVPGQVARSSSSSSSSSNENIQQPIVGTQPVEVLSGQTVGSQMGPGQMTTGLQGQTYGQSYGTGYTQGMQTMPNTGISGTGTMPMPVNQQGELPPTKTLMKNEAKVGLVQKVKEKLMHHNTQNQN